MRGLATRRARWNPRLPLTVGLVVVLGAALPAAIAVGGGTMLDDGVRSAVAAARPSERGVEVTIRRDAADPEAQARVVRDVLGRTFDGVTVRTATGLRSGNLPLGGVPRSPRGEIRLVAEVLPAAARDRARLTAGEWPGLPAAAGGNATPVEAALQARTAAALGIGVGDRLALGEPGTPTARTVDVVGLWEPRTRDDPVWFDDPLELTGAERDTVLGPLLVPAGSDGTPPDLGDQWTARWRAVLSPDGLRAGDVDRLANRLARLPKELETVPTAGGSVARTAGGLATTLSYPRSAVPLARSATVAVLVVVVGLVVLVAAQAAALLAADRARESGVLRARGASRRQQLRLTASELLAVAVLAVVPAALLAVVTLASPLGPAAGRPLPTGLVAALGCFAVALVVSAVVQVLLARRRPPRGPDAPRVTLDLVLAAALGLALWQAWAVSRAAADRVDPLVVAPAIALGAAGVLVVRGLGPLARSLGRLARRDGAVPALVGWHAARRGTRPAAPLVAVVVVAATAVVALSARATVEHAAADRTAAELGADVVVSGSPQAPAGDVATPVLRLDGSLGEEEVAVLAADATRLPDVTRNAGRWALDAAQVRRLGAPPGYDRGGLALAPGPALGLTLSLATDVVNPESIPGFVEVDVGGPPPLMPVTALLAAPDGTQRSLRMPDLAVDGGPHTLTAPLPPGLAGAGGVRLAALQVDVPADSFVLLGSRLDVRAVISGGRPAATATRGWQALALDAGRGSGDGWSPEAVAGAGGTVVRVTATPLSGAGTVTLRLVPDAPVPPREVPALLAGRVAERLGVGPGATLDADAAGRRVRLRVAGVAADGLPGGRAAGTPDDGLVPSHPAPGVLVDLATLGEVTRTAGLAALSDPTTWWLGTGSDAGARAVAAAARTDRPGADVQVRADVVQRRVADPFSDGLRRVLLLAALAALAVALGALLLGDVVATSSRRGELVVLRALGVSRGQLRRVVVTERALIGVTSLLAGLALGLAVAPVLVPALTGVPTAPGLGVRYDLPWIALAAAGLAVAVLAGALAAGRRAVRLRPAAVLREDPA